MPTELVKGHPWVIRAKLGYFGSDIAQCPLLDRGDDFSHQHIT